MTLVREAAVHAWTLNPRSKHKGRIACVDLCGPLENKRAVSVHCGYEFGVVKTQDNRVFFLNAKAPSHHPNDNSTT